MKKALSTGRSYFPSSWAEAKTKAALEAALS
jgi:hypothetical protein